VHTLPHRHSNTVQNLVVEEAEDNARTRVVEVGKDSEPERPSSRVCRVSPDCSSTSSFPQVPHLASPQAVALLPRQLGRIASATY
jgi:hypothetical protein